MKREKYVVSIMIIGLLFLLLFTVVLSCSQTVEIKKLNGEAITNVEIDNNK